MRFYGGSPLAYAACFGLKEAVQTMLHSGRVSLNDLCKTMGIAPIHAVVACGNMEMYDFLMGETNADPTLRTGRSTIGSFVGMRALTPLQLAAYLGDHTSFTHVLKYQVQKLWKMGTSLSVRHPTERH